MKNYAKKGFTLLELLIVVLIIGVLASIALPQYQKAVQKSRLSQLDVILDAVKKNVQIYVLANSVDEVGDVPLAGRSSVVDVALPGDCSYEDVCLSSLGRYYAAIYAGLNQAYVYVHISTMWSPESVVSFQQTSDRHSWEVVGIVNPRPVLCQWINERGYVAYPRVGSDCLNVGVGLTNVIPD